MSGVFNRTVPEEVLWVLNHVLFVCGMTTNMCDMPPTSKSTGVLKDFEDIGVSIEILVFDLQVWAEFRLLHSCWNCNNNEKIIGDCFSDALNAWWVHFFLNCKHLKRMIVGVALSRRHHLLAGYYSLTCHTSECKNVRSCSGDREQGGLGNRRCNSIASLAAVPSFIKWRINMRNRINSTS